MAVKKHELVPENHQLDLNALQQYLQLMNEQPHYLPPPLELVKNCQDIVKCLVRASILDDLWQLLHSVELFLIRVVNTVHEDIRHEIVTAILDKFNSYISDPQSDAAPMASVVLVVLTGEEAMLSASRWLVQQGDKDPAGAGLRASLSCLYRWLSDWHGTPSLGDWVMAYIKALEENGVYRILIEVSVDNLSQLLLAMDEPVFLRQSVADVIFHVLASLRESTEALDRIAPHIGGILTNLASESGQWSRQLLQSLVDILTAMMDTLSGSLKGEAADAFRAKYSEVYLCLERHMASRGCRFLQLEPWRATEICVVTSQTHDLVRRVGLLNLGNTCYMNSVMQALFLTRHFSTHVMLKMMNVAYWSKLSVLFAKMMHSISTKLNPDDFFDIIKPPFFSRDNQHDSSEFLGYLFQLLQSYEHSSDVNFDYTRPVVLTGTSRMRALSHSPSTSDTEHDNNGNLRSMSPRPSSSAAGSSAGQKRLLDGEIHHTMKRLRMTENVFLRRDSFVDNLFGGVLLTRVECIECHSSSLSRDVFRDLQLAFPEKLEGQQYSVQNLLDYYCSKERLTGENRYECRDCGGLRDAERSVLIETTPKYLILVLKNFKFEPKLQVQTKLMHSTNHNEMVTLASVRSQADHSTYTLYAAVIHAGTTLDSGHYYTLAKDKDQWHIYNDDNVSATDETQINSLQRSCTPYILFYRRTDIEEGTSPSFHELPSKLQQSVTAHNKHYVDTVRKMHLTRP